MNKQELIKRCRAAIYSPGVSEETKQIHRIALALLMQEPITLPRVNHPAQLDYADKVAEVLKANGLKVAGYDDE